MTRIGDNELLFYENLIAQSREIEMAAKRALYWTDDPEVASQLATVLSSVWRIRDEVIKHKNLRYDEVARLNGKV